MLKLKSDLHNHTKYCNHAVGEVYQYVEKAIEQGITHFGFSCHAPMHHDEGNRMTFPQMGQYKNEVLEARERYKDKIDVLYAFEVDYLPGFMDERIVGNKEVDYLIGSVHFINQWGVDHPDSIFDYQHGDVDKIWEDYLDTLAQMAKYRKFNIVGHFDLVKIFKFLPKKDIRSKLETTLKAIKDSGMALEINASGLRKPIGEQYPSLDVLKMANAFDIPITFTSDAHSPEHVGFGREVCEKIAKEAGYTEYICFKQRDKIRISIA